MLVIATIAAAAAAATIARGRNVSRMPIILTVQIPTCDLSRIDRGIVLSFYLLTRPFSTFFHHPQFMIFRYLQGSLYIQL